MNSPLTPHPKSMAKILRTELNSRKIEISQSASLEIVARQFGLKDWNTLSALTPAADSPSKVSFESPYPVLRIFDEAKAKEHYIDFLGFKIDWEHRFQDNYPLYCQISMGSLVLHLSGHNGDSTPGATTFVRMRGIKDFQKSLQAKDYKHSKPSLSSQPWGDEMTIADPFNNTIRFTEAKT